MATVMSKKPNKVEDPFFGLKYIAFSRTGLPLAEEDMTEEAFVTFARWQICKVRNVLWHDPVWDNYTEPEIIAEFFAIKFDENPEERQKFANQMVKIKDSELAALERMEARYLAEKNDKIKGDKSSVEATAQEVEPPVPEDFEDKY